MVGMAERLAEGDGGDLPLVLELLEVGVEGIGRGEKGTTPP